MRRIGLISTALFLIGPAGEAWAEFLHHAPMGDGPQLRLFASHVSIWGEATITELDPVTGDVIRSMPTPTTPHENDGLAFDGTYLYYNAGFYSDRTTLYKLDSYTGDVVGTYTLPDNQYWNGLAYRAGRIYLLDWHPAHENIDVFDLATETIVDSFDYSGAPWWIDGGLAYMEDADVLVVTAGPIGGDTTVIYELDPLTGEVLTSGFEYAERNRLLAGLAAVGDEIFVGRHVASTDQILVFSRDGVLQREFTITGSTGVQALAGGPVPEPSDAVALVGLGAMLLASATWHKLRRRPRRPELARPHAPPGARYSHEHLFPTPSARWA